jgi:DNA-binding transcriptional ArsR family regulator
VAKAKIPENHYRASRICRVLGNPTAYETLRLLQNSRLTPTQLSHRLGISIPAVSQVLRALRQLDLVRYDVQLHERRYWIKEETVLALLATLDEMIKHIRIKDY